MKWNAALYQTDHAFVFRHGEAVVEWLDPRPGERILDLGCGTGELTAKIRESAALVEGADSSADMIQRAKQSFPLVPFQVLDARSLPFEDEFDAIFSNATLHWIQEQDQVIHSVYRALKPGGRFVAEFGGKGNVQSITDALATAMTGVGLRFKAVWNFPTPASFAWLLEQSGFRVEMLHYFDRETRLAAGDDAMGKWLTMFGASFFGDATPEQQQTVVEEAVRTLKKTNYRDGQWYADYVRLRLIAKK